MIDLFSEKQQMPFHPLGGLLLAVRLLCESLILSDWCRHGGLRDTKAPLASSASEQQKNLEKVAELPDVRQKSNTKGQS